MVAVFAKRRSVNNQTTYKKGWSLVGGTVDEDESPLEAAKRETEEEVGLKLDANRFTFSGIRYAHPKDTMKDYIQVFFSAHLRADELPFIRPRQREISEYKFVALSQVKDYTDHPRMQAVEAMLKADTPVVYMEDEAMMARQVSDQVSNRS